MSWLEDVAFTPIATVATAAGVEVIRQGYLARCPACNEDRRSSKDRRPGCARLNPGRNAWHCFWCEQGGGAVDLLGRALFGSPLVAGDPRWAELRAFAANQGWCAAGQERVVAPAPKPAPPAPVEAGPTYPPLGEVAALWAASRSLADVSALDPARRWLERHRGISPGAVAALDLARVLPEVYPWPAWLPCGRTEPREWASVYRIAVPMFDAEGAMRSIRFRAVDRHLEPSPTGLSWRVLDIESAKKTLNARGHSYAGLVIADPMGIALLRGERSDDGLAWDGRVIVCEGEPDFWSWSTHRARVRELDDVGAATYAVLGVVSGSWSPAIAARIPDGATVTVRVHHDAPGEKYAAVVAESLVGRCLVTRSRPAEEREAA